MKRPAGQSKYQAVRQHLLTRIATMEVGDRLPSEHQLCDEFGVSRITLRHAVDGLVLDGRLTREHGRGTFVSAPPADTRFPERFADEVTGFFRQQTAAGHHVRTRVLRQELGPADAALAAELGIGVGDTTVELVRLRYVNEQLHQHVVTWLPHERFPEVATHDFSSGSLYDFLRERYGVVLARNDLVVRVEEATPDVALNLDVDADLRLLSVASTVFDLDDSPVAYGIARHTPSNSEIDLSLRVPRGTTPKEEHRAD